MDSDDPEARIRELEVGSYSENPGIAAPQQPAPAPPPTPYATGWAPPAPPPTSYGTGYGSGSPYGVPSGMGPFGGDVQRQHRRAGRGVRRIFFVVFALFMITPLWNVAHSLFAQLSHAFDTSSNDPRTVSKGGVLSVGGNGKTQTIACNDGTLTVGGNNNTFTVTGHCVGLEVTGNANHVTVDSADTIKAGGIDTVTIYHSGLPKIAKTGIDVSVEQG